MNLTSYKNDTESQESGNIDDISTTFFCNSCKKGKVKTHKGLNQHLRSGLVKVHVVATTSSSQPVLTHNEHIEDADSNVPTFKLSDVSGNVLLNDLNFIYDVP